MAGLHFPCFFHCRRLSIISLRSFTISLWILLSLLASRAFLFFSSCTRYWASKKADFSGVFQFSGAPVLSPRLKRFSFTFKRIHQGWDAASQVERDMQNLRTHFEVQNTTTLKHAGPEPRCLWEKEGKFICLLGHGNTKVLNEVRKDNPRQWELSAPWKSWNQMGCMPSSGLFSNYFLSVRSSRCTLLVFT